MGGFSASINLLQNPLIDTKKRSVSMVILNLLRLTMKMHCGNQDELTLRVDQLWCKWDNII